MSKLKPVLVQSKKKRKKIKKEIVNGNPPFKKLDEDNNRIVDQVNIDVRDLERLVWLALLDHSLSFCTTSGVFLRSLSWLLLIRPL